MQQIHRRHFREGLRVIGVTPLRGPVAELRDFVKRHGVTYPTLVDPGGKVARQYGLRAYPVTVVIDRRGRIRAVHRGFRAGEERELEREVRAALAVPHR